MKEEIFNSKNHYFGMGIALGFPLGIPVALAMGNIAFGPLIGALIGIVIGLYLVRKKHATSKKLNNKYLPLLLISFLLAGAFLFLFLVLLK